MYWSNDTTTSDRCLLGDQCCCCCCCTAVAKWFRHTFMTLLCPYTGRATTSTDTEFCEISPRIMDEMGSASSSVPERHVMLVKHSFVPYNKDELRVKTGQIVHSVYEENQWVFVVTDSGEQGYVPSNYLIKIDTHDEEFQRPKSSKKRSKKTNNPFASSRVNEVDSISSDLSDKDPPQSRPAEGKEDGCHENTLAKSLSFGEIELGDYDIFGYISDTSLRNSDSEQSLNGSNYSFYMEPFFKKPSGKFLVLHNFYGEDENDATILKGDCVTVLNKEDKDWYYVQTSDGTEGFAPRSYLWQATCSPALESVEAEDEDDLVL